MKVIFFKHICFQLACIPTGQKLTSVMLVKWNKKSTIKQGCGFNTQPPCRQILYQGLQKSQQATLNQDNGNLHWPSTTGLWKRYWSHIENRWPKLEMSLDFSRAYFWLAVKRGWPIFDPGILNLTRRYFFFLTAQNIKKLSFFEENFPGSKVATK